MNRNSSLPSMMAALLLAGILTAGCAAPKVTLFSDAAEPLKEFTLSGKGTGKVLVITVKGIIDDNPRRRLLRTEPSMVEEVAAQLKTAEKDKDIRAVLFKIDSPGGTATATDLLYHEITGYQQRTGAKVIASIMNVGASGGYYLALPADRIFAHPTSITGSVGVVFLRPQLFGLMDKIGVGVAVSKSGKNKDIGSPFRPATEEEDAIFQDLTDRLAERFIDRVRAHRSISGPALTDVATARIYIAEEARALGLVDEVGYLSDAVAAAKKMAGLAEDARVVVYRRTAYANDTIYNPATGPGAGPEMPRLDLGLLPVQAGFYYLWPMAAPGQ
ncbi:MAG: signal peptide peptidase SppA [Desulfobacterales bacterium]